MLPCVRGEEVEGWLVKTLVGAVPGAMVPPFHSAPRRRRCRPDSPRTRLLERCPVAPRMAAVLKAAAEAPPNAFAGGGYWVAMHGTWRGTTGSESMDVTDVSTVSS